MFLLGTPGTLCPDGAGYCHDILSRNVPGDGLASDRAADESLNPAQVGWTHHGRSLIVNRRAHDEVDGSSRR